MQAGKLADMLAHLPDMRVEIETNGTALPPARLDVRVDQYNVSPKLAHSGNPAELALKPEMLDRWATDPRAWFKFVIAELVRCGRSASARPDPCHPCRAYFSDARRHDKRSAARARAMACAAMPRSMATV